MTYDGMNVELGKIGKEEGVTQSKSYPRICPEGVRKTTQRLIQIAGVRAEI
jgi:hypothetical protein